MRLSHQGQWGIFRTRLAQGPHFDDSCGPLGPKLWGPGSDFIPTPAYLEEVERPSSGSSVVLKAGLDDIDKYLRQELSREPEDLYGAITWSVSFGECDGHKVTNGAGVLSILIWVTTPDRVRRQ